MCGPRQLSRSGDRNSVGARLFAPVETGPVTHPTSCTSRNEYPTQAHRGRRVALTTQSHQGPRLKKRTVIPLLPFRTFILLLYIFFSPGATTPIGGCILQPSSGFSLLALRGFLITHNDAPHSVGLLWTNDQSVAETSTWQHTTLTTHKHPCPGWDSNPRSRQASGRRPTP